MCSDTTVTRLPADACVFCNKTLSEIGGKRLIAQQIRGVTLTHKTHQSGDKDVVHLYTELFSDPLTYMACWGEQGLWTAAALASAKAAYLDGKRPWFCQICGGRKCKECGSPVNYPMATDVLYDDGNSAHVGIFPFNPGCSNRACSEYREWRGG